MTVKPVDQFGAVAASAQPLRPLLSPEQAGRGVLAAHRNGRRLFSDAVDMLAMERQPTAVMLAILAHEEFGKTAVLGLLAIIADQVARRKLWKGAYEDHAEKNRLTLFTRVVTQQEPIPSGDSPAMLVRKRERATYTDFVEGDETWSLPEEAFPRNEALSTVIGVFRGIRRYMMPSQAIGHMGEVWTDALSHTKEWGDREIAERDNAARAIEWGRSNEARLLDAVDSREGTLWNTAVRNRLLQMIREQSSANV